MFVDVFQVVLLSAATGQCLQLHFSAPTLQKDGNALTVPYSRYTAEPVAATTAPSIHMVNAMPTLPADLRITLGVAKILSPCG